MLILVLGTTGAIKMKCKKEGCNGTLRMCYLTTGGSSTINSSYLYVCDNKECQSIYQLKPELVTPEMIGDGRDKVLLYLQEQLAIIEHEMVNTPMKDNGGFMSTKRDNPDYIAMERNRKFIASLIKARRSL